MKIAELKSKIDNAKKFQETLLTLKSEKKRRIFLRLADVLRKEKNTILAANKKDVELARTEKSESFAERLALDTSKIDSIISTVKEIANAPENLFRVVSEQKRPSGIMIKKTVFPLGLIVIIYESRPNVTIDAFALSFKSGNAVILKGGKEIKNTNKVLVLIIKNVLQEFNLSPDIIADVSGLERDLTSELLSNRKIDCVIPRGGKNLIDYVTQNAKVPVIITGASVVHTYIDSSADLNLAKKVIINAKTRRVSICNALDVLLLHKNIGEKFLKNISDDLSDKNVELRADNSSYKILKSLTYPKLKKVGKKDFDTEFLDYILAIKIVNNFEEALEHIKNHTLGHSEAIITKNKKQAEIFFREVDAACLYLNTSTQFSDGGEFGLGGEIGISTQKLHARGPFSHQELTTYKYLVESKGAIRK